MEKIEVHPGDRVVVNDPDSTFHGRTMKVTRAVVDGAFVESEEGALSFFSYNNLALTVPNAITYDGTTMRTTPDKCVVAVLTEECMDELVDRVSKKVVQSLQK